jgi:predicted nucleic acid-binding protein
VAAYFFDSSALIKRYVDETGTGWVTTVAGQNYIFVAGTAVVEVVSAIERRKRTGAVKHEDAVSTINRFRIHLSSEYALVDISRALIAEASTLAETHGLQSSDALQLAAALRVQKQRQTFTLSELILVSSDPELNKAAIAEGLTVDDPNIH